MRKLAIAAFYFSAAIFISRYFLPHEWLLNFGAVAAACSVTGIIFAGNMRKRIIIALLSLAVGFIWSWVFTTVFVKPYWNYHGETKTISAVVTDYPVERQPRGYRADASVKLDGYPSIGIRLYYYNEADIKPGDIIEVTAVLRRTDITDDGDRLDVLSSRSLFLSAAVSGNITIVDTKNNIWYLPKIIAGSIAGKIDEIYPKDVSPFMQALLMGKRDELYRDTTLSSSLSASGIIHIISISGMHISFLMGFLALVIRNKRLFSIYGIPALLFFMAMTGFTPAVTRAGIMQIFLICAPMLRRERDGITSLSAALLVLLAANPYSSASVGLHLSFSATLGIIIFTTRINNSISDLMREKKYYRKKVPRAVINFVTSNLATTTGAIILTLPLTAIHFGYVSLIAPLTNLITIGVVSLVFPLGLITAIFGFISPALAVIAAVPITQLARYIIFIARSFAAIPYSVVYTSNAYIMFWLAYIYIIFTALPMLKARARQYLYPGCLALILLFAVILLSSTIAVDNSNAVTVIDVGQGLSVAVTSNEHLMLVDCGSNSSSNAGETVHEYIMNMGHISIDLLVITHFHSDHINGIELLLSRMTVSALAIPDPEKSFLAEDIINLARKRGTDIMYVTETLCITLGDMVVYIYPPLGSGDENERGLGVLTVGDVTALITGDMSSSTERALLRYAHLPTLDLLVIGHHGSRHSTSEELLNTLKPGFAVISVGKNSFGHPSPEVIDRLEKAGTVTYRTDENGHVTLRGQRR